MPGQYRIRNIGNVQKALLQFMPATGHSEMGTVLNLNTVSVPVELSPSTSYRKLAPLQET